MLVNGAAMHSLTIRRSGFTLVEVMVAILITALIVAIALPNLFRARKRSQATHILDDLRVLNGALDQYAIDTTKLSGAPVNWSDIQGYLKQGSLLYNSNGTDIFGNFYICYTVDGIPKLSSATYTSLSDVAPLAFWSPYYP
jgi:prepilin-type N-terminal cleavage/methylation domain-containing protein